MKRILITGGAGSIGSELVRQLAPKNKIFILDQNETATFDLREELKHKGYWVHSRTGDIRDKDVVSDVFEDFKPQVVYHCAALKHVTPNEEYPIEAIQTNIIGTYNVLNEAKRWECLEKFVFISTDKAINAHSLMGATKRVGEIMVTNQGKGFVAVRFGNVLGSRGSLIPIWQAQHDKGLPITVTDKNMERYFMTIPEACALVIRATKEEKGIVVLDMGKKVNIYDLALKVIKEARGEVEVIGVRKGETLDEKLMTEEEEKRAIKKDNYYLI